MLLNAIERRYHAPTPIVSLTELFIVITLLLLLSYHLLYGHTC